MFQALQNESFPKNKVYRSPAQELMKTSKNLRGLTVLKTRLYLWLVAVYCLIISKIDLSRRGSIGAEAQQPAAFNLCATPSHTKC